MPTFEIARTDDGLLRKELAKMMSAFATRIMHKVPDRSRNCVFADVGSIASSEQHDVELACYLGLMGLDQS